MGERALDIRLLHLLVGVFADHLDVAAERECTERILGVAFLFNPQLGTKADGKRQNSNP